MEEKLLRKKIAKNLKQYPIPIDSLSYKSLQLLDDVLVEKVISDNKQLYIIIKMCDKMGVYLICDDSLKSLIPIRYDDIEYFGHYSSFRVREGSLYGMYNLNGDIIIPVEYACICPAIDVYTAWRDAQATIYSLSGDIISIMPVS